MKTQMSFLCSTIETCGASAKIHAWIAARESEGWTVDFTVRCDGDDSGILWQCTKHKDGSYSEFTPSIDMFGNEGRHN